MLPTAVTSLSQSGTFTSRDKSAAGRTSRRSSARENRPRLSRAQLLAAAGRRLKSVVQVLLSERSVAAGFIFALGPVVDWTGAAGTPPRLSVLCHDLYSFI